LLQQNFPLLDSANSDIDVCEMVRALDVTRLFLLLLEVTTYHYIFVCILHFKFYKELIQHPLARPRIIFGIVNMLVKFEQPSFPIPEMGTKCVLFHSG